MLSLSSSRAAVVRSSLEALLLLVLVRQAAGCMKGYEDERDRLKEHLGIEWIPNGLDLTSWSKKQPIRHDYDLNCDFSRPHLCRWKNVEEKHMLDTLDFHLFEKTDHTEFPALQVRPGPSKVAQGDRLVFTGDIKTEEQYAILYSSPIGCQSSKGLLTFTFWVYNNARVEVLVLEDDEGDEGRLRIAPFKPYVDCGTVQLNTECSVEIPARSQPFRLGIRAYDMANKEGSFVMLDNILYNATLCHVSIDLGAQFRSEPLLSTAQGAAIERAAQLDCFDFDASCRWRSTGSTSTIWRVSTTAPPPDLLFNATGVAVPPSGRFAVLYIEQEQQPPYAVLRSDAIACQSTDENSFKFRFWKSSSVELQVCATDMAGRPIECHAPPTASAPAPVTVKFARAASDFMISLVVVRVDTRQDNVLFVDDLFYRAALCHEALSPFDLGRHFYATPLLSILLSRRINSALELACDFSHRAAACMWANEAPDETAAATSNGGTATSNEAAAADAHQMVLSPGEEPVNEGERTLRHAQWMVGDAPLNREKFYSLTASHSLPNGEFGVVAFRESAASSLMSEVMGCMSADATLSFSVWRSGDATVQVCLVDEDSPSVIDCQTVHATGQVIVDIPQIERAFRIAIRAESKSRGMVIVDDISAQGELCSHGSAGSAPRQHAAAPFGRGRTPIVDANVCRLLTCDFEHSACLYQTATMSSRSASARFEWHQGRMETRLDADRPSAILESPAFQLNTIARLHFSFTNSDGNANLFVCNDGAKKEFENCYKVETGGGSDGSHTGFRYSPNVRILVVSHSRSDYIELLPSDTRVYAVARLAENAERALVMLHSFRLTDAEDTPSC